MCAGLNDLLPRAHTREVSDPFVFGPDRPSTGEWSLRYKANVERLRSGDPKQVAEAIEILRHLEKRVLAYPKARNECSTGPSRKLTNLSRVLSAPSADYRLDSVCLVLRGCTRVMAASASGTGIVESARGPRTTSRL